MERDFILSGGFVVTEDNVLEEHSLVISAGKIVDIVSGYVESKNVLDCRGKYILPGLIDIHSDMIEHLIVPRKGIIFEYDQALRQADRQLIGQGITTMYHSISVANSTICNRSRTLSVDEMLKIGDVICSISPNLLIHHYSHIRFELNTIEAYDEIYERVKHKRVHELSIMDHTPGQGQYTNITRFEKEIRKQYGNVSDDQVAEIIDECKNKPQVNEEQIEALLRLADKHKIPMAYHDVGKIEDIEFMKKYNINICEFPLNLESAKEATANNFYSVVGAPNILRNGSHNNNASAIELIERRLANIICSDYYPSAMLSSIFYLTKKIEIPLQEAVKFVTLNPAKAVKIDDKYGSLAIGKQADIIIVDPLASQFHVAMAFVDGIKKAIYRYQ